MKIGNDQIVLAKILPPFFGQLGAPNEDRREVRFVEAANAVDLDSLERERGNCFVCQNVYLRVWKGIAERVNSWQSQNEVAKRSAAGDEDAPTVNMK